MFNKVLCKGQPKRRICYGGHYTVKGFHTASSIKSSPIKWTRQTPGGETVWQFHNITFLWESARRG